MKMRVAHGLIAYGLRVALWSVLAVSAHAHDILITAANVFFDPNDSTRAGIEVEFVGLDAKQAADVVAKVLQGSVSAKTRDVEYHLDHIEKDGRRVYAKKMQVTDYVIDSRIGEIVLKTELNLTAEDSDGVPQRGIVELVTRPLIYSSVVELQKAMDALKRAGARGTEGVNPVATQVNTELANGKVSELEVMALVNLMRNVMYAPNRRQALARLNIASRREAFLRPYSPGFLKRLFDSSYHPTKRELYDDFIYRQSLELMGEKEAWSMPIAKARERLLEYPDPVVPRVVKCNPLRISSVLMMMFPEDPMSQVYQNSGWARALPIAEWRDWNTDFDVVTPFRQALGLISATHRFGAFDHDLLISTASGVEVATINDIREQSAEKGEHEPVIVRYFLGDPETVDRSEYKDQAKLYKGTTVAFLPGNKYGQMPLTLPGESVVFHRRPFHRFSIMGKYNPGLINFNIAQALENKYVENRFWNHFVPNAMPKARLMADYLQQKPGRAQIKMLLERINRDFPNGWVMKGTWDLGSEKNIVTDKTDVMAALDAYWESDFDKAMARAQKAYGQSTPEYVLADLKDHPGLMGWKILRMLERPFETFLQERVRIKHEFRVEVIAGRVLGDGSTFDRYAYTFKYADYATKESEGKKYVEPPREVLESAEIFAQNIVDRLPVDLRGMPMGMDVAILEDGKAILIESNPGGNSNYLFEEEEPSVRALESFMKRYPAMVRDGLVHEGKDPSEQMTFLRERFREWGIDLPRMYPRMQFLEDRIEDPVFKPLRLGKEELHAARQKRCSALLDPEEQK